MSQKLPDIQAKSVQVSSRWQILGISTKRATSQPWPYFILKWRSKSIKRIISQWPQRASFVVLVSVHFEFLFVCLLAVTADFENMIESLLIESERFLRTFKDRIRTRPDLHQILTEYLLEEYQEVMNKGSRRYSCLYSQGIGYKTYRHVFGGSSKNNSPTLNFKDCKDFKDLHRRPHNLSNN